MKEISDIVRAYNEARVHGLKVALATVVKVEGSSYRRPGARMLVTEDGMLTGAISGGCLEGDAKRRALLSIGQRKNKLIVYDTMNEEGEAWGIQLGCNGIVHILFEPIDAQSPHNPMQLLQRLFGQRSPASLATLFCNESPEADHPGTCLLRIGEEIWSDEQRTAFHEKLMSETAEVLGNEKAAFKEMDAQLTALVDYIAPSISLLVAGAGNDAIPLVNMAHAMGWHVTVTDGRPTHANKGRFSLAQNVLVVKSGEPVPGFIPDAQTAFMLMTHNYNYDLAALRQAIAAEGFYIGILGPKKKREQMLSDLRREGEIISDDQERKLFGPAGLDICAETAEEIALSVIAEIKAVFSGGNAVSLREKSDFIHPRPLHASQS